METIFYYFAICNIIVAIPFSLFISIMGANDSIVKGIIGFIGTMLLITLIPTSLAYLILSMFDWVIDFCRESHQTLLVSSVGAILIFRGLITKRKVNLTSTTLKITLKLFYIICGSILIWYGINFGYGNLNWNSILTFFIVSGIIECTIVYIDWKKKGNSLRKLFSKD